MTNKEAAFILETMAISITGAIASEKSSYCSREILEQKIEAINLAQKALRFGIEAEQLGLIASLFIPENELQFMNGEPVWVCTQAGSAWGLVTVDSNKTVVVRNQFGGELEPELIYDDGGCFINKPGVDVKNDN